MTQSHAGLFDLVKISDYALSSRCSAALSRLDALDDSALLEALADPREVHKTLYLDLVPEVCQSLVGNFRGSNVAILKDAVVYFTYDDIEGTTDISKPQDVDDLMKQYANKIGDFDLEVAEELGRRLSAVAEIMALFGKIHPFLDGNGHVQRITAQCLLERAGYKMNASWRIHPCPYGEKMHRALAASDLAGIASMLNSFVE